MKPIHLPCLCHKGPTACGRPGHHYTHATVPFRPKVAPVIVNAEGGIGVALTPPGGRVLNVPRVLGWA